MAIAHVILSEELYDTTFVKQWTEGFEPYKKLVLSQYSPKAVSSLTGIPAETIERLAREFATTKPALAIRGKEALNWPGGSYTSHAIFCLNALVGSIDVPGGVLYQENPKYRDLPPVEEDEIAKKGKGQPSLDLHGTDKFPAAKVVTNQIPESILEGKPYPVEMAIGFNSNFNHVCSRIEALGRGFKEAALLCPCRSLPQRNGALCRSCPSLDHLLGGVGLRPFSAGGRICRGENKTTRGQGAGRSQIRRRYPFRAGTQASGRCGPSRLPASATMRKGLSSSGHPV